MDSDGGSAEKAGSIIAAPASATLLSFNLEWSGEPFGNDAAATGMITMDDTVFPYPAIVFRPAEPFGMTYFMITIFGASDCRTYTLAQ